MTNRLILPVLALCCFISMPAHAAKKMSVQIREGKLRSTPSFLGTTVATVKYGDRFTVSSRKGVWIKVTNPDTKTSGWIHESALTKKRIKLKAGSKDADVAASSGELALASKGFSSDVEAQFKSKNKDIDFSWIDKMEKIKVSPAKAKAFLKAGKVETPNGGAR